jgi:hypothetical protein
MKHITVVLMMLLLSGCITITQTPANSNGPVEVHLTITMPDGNTTTPTVVQSSKAPEPIIIYKSYHCEPIIELMKVKPFDVMPYLGNEKSNSLIKAALFRMDSVDKLIAKSVNCK